MPTYEISYHRRSSTGSRNSLLSRPRRPSTHREVYFYTEEYEPEDHCRRHSSRDYSTITHVPHRESSRRRSSHRDSAGRDWVGLNYYRTVIPASSGRERPRRDSIDVRISTSTRAPRRRRSSIRGVPFVKEITPYHAYSPYHTATHYSPSRYEDPHTYCLRTDSTYADLYHRLLREREHKESVRRMKERIGYGAGASEKRALERMYVDACEEVGRLERRVEERRRAIMRE